MRKIIGQYTTRNGDLKAIYSVSGAIFKTKDIEIGAWYEIEYLLGKSEMYLKGKLVSATDGNRTLFFKLEDSKRKSIGIPIMNILRYVKK